MNSIALCVWACLCVAISQVHCSLPETPEVVQYAFQTVSTYAVVSDQVDRYCGEGLRGDFNLSSVPLPPGNWSNTWPWNRTKPYELVNGTLPNFNANLSCIIPEEQMNASCWRIKDQLGLAMKGKSLQTISRAIDVLISKLKIQLHSFLNGEAEIKYALLRLEETTNINPGLNLTESVFDQQYFIEAAIAALGQAFVKGMNSGEFMTRKETFLRLNHTVETMCKERVCTANFKQMLQVFKRIATLFSATIRNRVITAGVDASHIWVLLGAPTLRGFLFGSPLDLKKCKSHRGGRLRPASPTWYNSLSNVPDMDVCVGDASPETRGLFVKTWPSGQPGVPFPHGCRRDAHCVEETSVCNVTTRTCSSTRANAGCNTSNDCQGRSICKEGSCIQSEIWDADKFAAIDKAIPASTVPSLDKLSIEQATVWMGFFDEQAAHHLSAHPVIQEMLGQDTALSERHNSLQTFFKMLQEHVADSQVDVLEKLKSPHSNATIMTWEKAQECSDYMLLLGFSKQPSLSAKIAKIEECAAYVTYTRSICFRNIAAYEKKYKPERISRLRNGTDDTVNAFAKQVNESLATKKHVKLTDVMDFKRYVGSSMVASFNQTSFQCKLPFNPIKVFTAIAPLMLVAKDAIRLIMQRLESKIELALEIPDVDIDGKRMGYAPAALEAIELIYQLSHGCDSATGELQSYLDASQSSQAVKDELGFWIKFYKAFISGVQEDIRKMVLEAANNGHEPQSIFKGVFNSKVGALSYTKAFDGEPFHNRKHNCSQAALQSPPKYLVDCRKTSQTFDPSIGAIKSIPTASQACPPGLEPYIYLNINATKGDSPRLFCSVYLGNDASKPLECQSDVDCKSLGAKLSNDRFGKSVCSSSLAIPLFDRYRGRCLFEPANPVPHDGTYFNMTPILTEYLKTKAHYQSTEPSLNLDPSDPYAGMEIAGELLGKTLVGLVDDLVTSTVQALYWTMEEVSFHGIHGPNHKATILWNAVDLDMPLDFDELLGTDEATLLPLVLNTGVSLLLLAVSLGASVLGGILQDVALAMLDVVETRTGTGIVEDSLCEWLSSNSEAGEYAIETEQWTEASLDMGEPLEAGNLIPELDGEVHEAMSFGENMVEFRTKPQREQAPFSRKVMDQVCHTETGILLDRAFQCLNPATTTNPIYHHKSYWQRFARNHEAPLIVDDSVTSSLRVSSEYGTLPNAPRSARVILTRDEFGVTLDYIDNLFPRTVPLRDGVDYTLTTQARATFVSRGRPEYDWESVKCNLQGDTAWQYFFGNSGVLNKFLPSELDKAPLRVRLLLEGSGPLGNFLLEVIDAQGRSVFKMVSGKLYGLVI